MTPNYVRDVLLTMDSTTRKALHDVARGRVNADPNETESPMTRLWYAVYCQAVDVIADEQHLLAELERDL